MKRSWEGAVLKVFGAKDFSLAVTGREQIGPQFMRIRVDGGSLLADCGVHPTMWIRLWFDDNGKPHQRAFTLVNPDAAAGTFSLDFALHEGRAADWARAVKAGETIDATVQGSKFDLPDPAPTAAVLVGDPASIPAINSLLTVLGDIPATIWLEYSHDPDRSLPVHARATDTVSWVPRQDGGDRLVGEVCAALTARAEATGPGMDTGYYWLAAEAASTRAITRHLRKTLGVDKRRINALGYWRSGEAS
ncbi:siderophore-interacting protein [Arthrobacter sp. G.S.26]|uniref:siderophore-interacting protein n=1 Tax=Arthrobacter sp. G.S.26 TaxID=3433706 RepID=UPI003D77289C